MRITVDENIPGSECFAAHGAVTRVAGRGIGNSDLRDTDALIVRSVTRVDESLLRNTPVKFVGTATIGTDHLDMTALENLGVRVASAPGCNADSAAQYTLAMIMLAGLRRRQDLQSLTVGIVGRGNVGSRLQSLLGALGVSTIANDPPLEDIGVTGLVPIGEIQRCQVITLHVPLTKAGNYPTFGMVGQDFLSRLAPETLLVNSSRGDVCRQQALLDAVDRKHCHAALDVWPGEPDISTELLDKALVASPHVAGYSLDGKYNGTRMIYRAFCDWAGIEHNKPRFALDPVRITLQPAMETSAAIRTAVLQACPVHRDDGQLRRIAWHDPELVPGLFDRLRLEYPERRDFSGCVIRRAPAAARPILRNLGFELE